MNDSESLSISISRSPLLEEMSLSYAALEEARSQKQESISNEQIKKGDPVIDTYEVTSDAISGGMGSVWKVYHKGWNSDLAMKRPQPRFFSEGSSKKKEEFIMECENWINLGLHPNIVSCYYVREIGGVPTIFSEWMDGGSLKDAIVSGTLYSGSEEEVQKRILDIAIQVARGLSYSHKHNLIHQDIKPGNILFSKDWETKISDFGLSITREQERESESSLSPDLAEKPKGYTRKYSSPEQMRGEEPAEWMDVYSWALVVWEMYLGDAPWGSGEEALPWLEKNLAGDTGYTEARVQMPDALSEYLLSCAKIRNSGEYFEGIEERLRQIYRESMGEVYPRKQVSLREDTAGTLNNRALSFLDLGREREAIQLWQGALDADPMHMDTVYNRKLLAWRKGQITDEQAVAAVTELPDGGDPEYKEILLQMLEEERGRKSAHPGTMPDLKDAEMEMNADAIAFPIREERYDTNTILCFREEGFWIADQDEEVRLVDLEGNVLRKIPGVFKMKAFSQDESLLAVIEKRTGIENKKLVGESRFCCAIYDTESGEKRCILDEGICSENSRVFFLTEGLLAIEGVESYETTYNEHEDEYDTEDVSDEYIRVYDLSSAEKVYALKKDRRLERFSAMGLYLVCAYAKTDPGMWSDKERSIVLLDAKTGNEIRTIATLETPVDVLHFTKDADKLFITTYDGMIRVFSLPEGVCEVKKQVHKPNLNTHFLMTGKDGRMLTAESGGLYRYWDKSGRCMLTCRGGFCHPWIANGEYDIVLFEKKNGKWSMVRIQVPKEKTIARYSVSKVRSIKEQVSAQEKFARLMDEARAAKEDRRFDKAYMLCNQARSIPGFENTSDAVRFCELLGTYGTRMNLRSIREIDSITSDTEFYDQSLSYTWNGNRLLYIRGDALSVIECGIRASLYSFRPDGEKVRSAVSIPGRDWIVVVTDKHTYLLSESTGTVMRKLSTDLEVNDHVRDGCLAISADGKYLAVRTMAEHGGLFRKKTKTERIVVWNIGEDRREFFLDTDKNIEGLAFSSDGKKIYAGNDGKLYVISWQEEGAEAELICSYDHLNHNKYDLSVTLRVADHDRYLIMKGDETILGYDFVLGKMIMMRARFRDAVFVPRTERLMCACNDGSLRVAEMEEKGAENQSDDLLRSGEERICVQTSEIKRVDPLMAISKDGRFLAVTREKNGVQLYEMEWNYRMQKTE